MTNGDDEYITMEEARQVLRHAANGRVRSRTEGRRLFLHRGDVERLAHEVGADHRSPPAQEGELLAEASPLIDYVRDLTGQLMVATRRVGELEGLLQQRLLPADEANLRHELADARAVAQTAEARIGALEAENARLKRPWWQRLLGGD